MFAIRAAEAATTLVPSLIMWLSIRAKWPVWFGIPVDAIFALVGGLVMVSLIADWWTTRFTIGAGGVSFEEGLAVRRSTSLGWSEVVSVQVSQSAAGRLLGCSRVLIGIGAESKGNLVIEAVPKAVAAEIEGYFKASRSAEETDSGPGVVSVDDAVRPEDDDLIYRIRARDYLMLSITYGQFLLVIPFLMGFYENITGLFSLSLTVPALPGDTAAQALLMIAVLVVAVPVALGFGTAVAWLRYRGFEVRGGGGMFAMSGGLAYAESRQVSRIQVAGIRIQQNPLMRVTGYARLSFVSRQSGERIGANVIFPAARLAFLRDEIRRHFPEYAPAMDRSCTISRPLRWCLVSAGAVILILAGVAVHGMPSVRAVVIMAAVAFLLLAAGNYGWATADLDADNSVIVFRRGFLWVTHYVVPCDSVYFIHSYRLALSSRLSVAALCLGVYDSRAIRLWVPTRRTTLPDRFIEMTSAR
ncbi:PH domain-containing protein [Actinoplanes sp. NEAU-A12]|uniref:PH domain-containing protein n=1 Tax=Actinoplanes sandaracinus TaxID=3045177 RepID=A0ABT6WVX1_9ACTN|nr:PH domain-containing protein [Actinoplanes sandaracinus]MDI6103887.1 PH domain-containing protein [Actinoplanes sandaracinus]